MRKSTSKRMRFLTQDDAAKGEKWIFLSSKDGDLVDRAATVAIFEKHRPTCPVELRPKRV